MTEYFDPFEETSQTNVVAESSNEKNPTPIETSEEQQKERNVNVKKREKSVNVKKKVKNTKKIKRSKKDTKQSVKNICDKPNQVLCPEIKIKHGNKRVVLNKETLEQISEEKKNWIKEKSAVSIKNKTVAEGAEERLAMLKEILQNIETDEKTFNELITDFTLSGYTYTEKKVVDAIKTRKPTPENLKTNWDLHVSIKDKLKMALMYIKTLKASINELKKFMTNTYSEDIHYFKNKSWEESNMFRTVMENDALYPHFNNHHSLLENFHY